MSYHIACNTFLYACIISHCISRMSQHHGITKIHSPPCCAAGIQPRGQQRSMPLRIAGPRPSWCVPLRPQDVVILYDSCRSVINMMCVSDIKR